MRSARRRLEPATIIVFGGTGDLMERKLLPALYRLAEQGLRVEDSHVLGVARSAGLDDAGYRAWVRRALHAAGLWSEERSRAWCDRCVHFQRVGGDRSDELAALGRRIESLEQAGGLPGNRVFYLALPPEAFPGVIARLGEAGLHRSRGWTRLVIEKPFGRDLLLAQELNGLVHRHFAESQVYRIDHYLGKETVQNLLGFRFANPVFEALWNRDRIESVQITVAEPIGVEGRAVYYERAGALRDIVQNHLTQLLTLVAMEVPGALEADLIRNEKVKVLRAIQPIDRDQVVFGQYARGRIDGVERPAYREEPGVAPDSRTETFAALRLAIQNWRWHGVPFYIRTGKRMPRRLTEIVVTFRRPPVSVFEMIDAEAINPNRLVVTIQPDEGFDFHVEVKTPGSQMRLESVCLRFRYSETFAPLPDAYETLLLDILRGDQTLFVRADETEAAWRLYAPVLEHPPQTHSYPAGTWGPREAKRLLRRGQRWLPA